MMLSSKTLEERNNDPEPYVLAFDGSVRMSAENEFWQSRATTRVPRPDFQHGKLEANPILLAYRAYLDDSRIDTAAGYWLFGIDTHRAFGGFNDWSIPSHNFHSLTLATNEQREHARRVFVLLIAVSA